MRLFAPRNDWDMTAPAGSNWFGMGGVQTTSGVRITEYNADTFSAMFAGKRIISETLASLPCATLEQIDARTTRKAIEHPLWPILHDQPNPEQDIMSWLDSQVGFQICWGNAYAEIQRDTLGKIVALWMIHPSRIPLCNIVRNPTDPRFYDRIVVGEPGEIVYFVNNDDGTKSPIPASDMLHVPGVMSANGITGQSIVRWAANSIGIALAAETHAGAIFKNGAVVNMALKFPGVLSDEAKLKLQQHWSKTYSGSQNHYKTLVLEQGMEPVPINMDPASTQLLASRQFSVTEVARWLRLPPHLLADLSRAINSNIEQEELSFLTHSMLPWIIRWEKAMQRQLLTDAEKKKYRFKFNVNGLLRGDQAARGQFYQVLFNLGAVSPNDIRDKEDMNPIPGGDQYFIQGNNAIPLDKIGELTQAKIDKLRQPPKQSAASMPLADESDDMTDSRDDTEANHQARLAELRAEMVAMIADYETALPEQVAQAVNTHAADEAQRREVAAEKALQAVRKALLLAIEGEADQLLRYEMRAAREAAKKPNTFLIWRDEFYPKFEAKLAAAISVFVPAAGEIGILIDASAESSSYVQQSIASLDELAPLLCDQLEQGMEQVMAAWSHRPKQFAVSIFRSAI